MNKQNNKRQPPQNYKPIQHPKHPKHRFANECTAHAHFDLITSKPTNLYMNKEKNLEKVEKKEEMARKKMKKNVCYDQQLFEE